MISHWLQYHRALGVGKFTLYDVDGSLKKVPGIESASDVRVFSDSVLMSGRALNILDCALVALQTIEEFVLTPLSNTDSGLPSVFNTLSNTALLRLLRIFRIVRLLRFVRLVRLFKELRMLIHSIATSFKSFLWTVFLLFLWTYIVSVFFTQTVADHLRLSEVEELESEQVRIMSFYWGNMGYSLLSLFQSFSGGVDWDNAVRPLMDTFSPAMAVVYSVYIALTTFVLLNLVTGIFVDSAARNLREEQEFQLVNQIREMFIESDENCSGDISWTEFERQLMKPEMDAFFRLLDLDRSEAAGFFGLLDIDNSGKVSAEEFVMGCLRLRGEARAIDLATLMNETRRMFIWLFEKTSVIEGSLQDLLNTRLAASRAELSGQVETLNPLMDA